MSVLANLSDIGPVVIGAGVLVTLATLVLNIRRSESERYLTAAVDLLEQAYAVLAPPEGQTIPRNVRVDWLAAARLVKTSQNISYQIKQSSHRSIYRAHREFWRARLHALIYPSDEGFPEEFFAESPEHFTFWSDADREPLSEASLAVLYRFVLPEDFENAIKDEPGFSVEEIERMQSFGPKALGRLMAKVRQRQK